MIQICKMIGAEVRDLVSRQSFMADEFRFSPLLMSTKGSISDKDL